MVEIDKMGSICRFNGDPGRWPVWRMDFRAMAVDKGLVAALIEDRPTDGTQAKKEAWDKANMQLYAKLALCTEGAAKALVQAYDAEFNGRAAWLAMVEKYEVQNLMRKTALQKELFNSSMEVREDPDIYFARTEEMRRQLQLMGLEVSDEHMIGIVLGNLSGEYKTLRTLLDAMETIEYETLKSHVRQFYRRDLADVQEELQAAMVATRVKCYRCKKTGHYAKACPGRQEDGDDVVVCHNCGGKGHMKADCPSEKKEQANTALQWASDLRF